MNQIKSGEESSLFQSKVVENKTENNTKIYQKIIYGSQQSDLGPNNF